MAPKTYLLTSLYLFNLEICYILLCLPFLSIISLSPSIISFNFLFDHSGGLTKCYLFVSFMFLNLQNHKNFKTPDSIISSIGFQWSREAKLAGRNGSRWIAAGKVHGSLVWSSSTLPVAEQKAYCNKMIKRFLEKLKMSGQKRKKHLAIQ